MKSADTSESIPEPDKLVDILSKLCLLKKKLFLILSFLLDSKVAVELKMVNMLRSSQPVCLKWKCLRRELKVKETSMDHFEDYYGDRLVLMLLVLWIQQAGKNANVGVLAKALVAIDLGHVALMLKP